MNIQALGKGLFERIDVGHMGQHAQFDLGIVGRDQLVAGLADKGRADLAAFQRADRNILQVGVRGGQTAGRRGGQRIGSVDTFCLRIDEPRQGVRIG